MSCSRTQNMPVPPPRDHSRPRQRHRATAGDRRQTSRRGGPDARAGQRGTCAGQGAHGADRLRGTDPEARVRCMWRLEVESVADRVARGESGESGESSWRWRRAFRARGSRIPLSVPTLAVVGDCLGRPARLESAPRFGTAGGVESSAMARMGVASGRGVASPRRRAPPRSCMIRGRSRRAVVVWAGPACSAWRCRDNFTAWSIC